jgi:hypothetical protein
LTDGGESDNIELRDPSYISARGPNEFKRGFSQANLVAHWEGEYDEKGRVIIHSHKEEYEKRHMTMKQYAERALNLIQSPCNEHIDGYKTADGTIVRFDRRTGDFVKGHPDKGIKTMFEAEQKYFEAHKKDESL